jgi:phosphate transport system protein
LTQARQAFDRDLSHLESEVVLMGGLVENAIFNAVDALKSRDLALSRRVADEDKRIDRKRDDIENACVGMLRREAPVATDLRRIISILLIASELERMGDYAKGIARLSLRMGNAPPLKELIDIPRMAELAVAMLKRSLEAFLERDPMKVDKLASSLAADDDQVDELNARVQDDLFALMKKNPDNVERASYLMWASHNFERIADRATNIAERAIFQASGRIVNIADAVAQGAVAT